MAAYSRRALAKATPATWFELTVPAGHSGDDDEDAGGGRESAGRELDEVMARKDLRGRSEAEWRWEEDWLGSVC